MRVHGLTLVTLILVTLILGSGCRAHCFDSDPPGTKARLDDPKKPLADFLAHPWPSDARKRPNGTLDLSALPNPTNSSTLDDYRKTIEESTSDFGSTVGIELAFDGPIDREVLDIVPTRYLDDDAPMYLVDVDTKSKERGRRFPLLHRYGDDPTVYLPAHHLIAMAPFGIPLRGGTTYALVGTNRMKAADGTPIAQTKTLHNALYDGCTDSAPSSIATMMAPLKAWLEDQGAVKDDVTFATVFTTHPSVSKLRQLAAEARAQPVPEVMALERVGTSTTSELSHPDAILLRGVIQMPGFQQGTIPYKTLGDGGAIAYDASGKPKRTHFETTRVSFVIPREAPGRMMPANGWPVVLYSHGTGGSYEDAYDPSVGETLAVRGIAVVGYDQVLHGPRDPTGSEPNYTFFNIFNPIAGRDNILQGTVDLAVLTNIISSGISFGPDLLGEGSARFDPSRIAFFGHSEGSTVGAPFVTTDERIKAAAFSGLGSILTLVLLHRHDIVDFKGLLISLFNLPASEVFDEFHPVLNIMQTFIEPADAIGYANSFPDDPPNGIRRDVLVVEGFLDFAAMPEGTEAFASGARIPVVSPVHRVPFAESLVGPRPWNGDAQDNVHTAGGSATYGLIQYPEETHYAVFESSDARTRYAEFLRSALYEGRATIRR